MFRLSKQLNRVLRYSSLVGVLLLMLFGYVSLGKAAVNSQITYQGKLTNNSSVSVSDSDYNFMFELYDASSEGNLLWSERWVSTTTQISTVNGIFSVDLGSLESLSSVDFNTESLYLQVYLDADTNGSWEEEFGARKRLTASPYAFNAETLSGISATSTNAIANMLLALDSYGNLNLYGQGVSSTYATTTQLFFVPKTVPDTIEGTVYYDSGDNTLYVYNGSSWVDALTQGSPSDWITTFGETALTPSTTRGIFVNASSTISELRIDSLRATSTLDYWFNASSTLSNWDYLTNRPATSTILSLLDSDYRINTLNATTTNIGYMTVYDTATFNWLSATSSLDYWFSNTSGIDTDDLTEGSNLYWTQSRWDTAFNSTTTWSGFNNLFDTRINASSTLMAIDISDDTNLAVSSPITLTGDSVGFDFSTNNTWTGLNIFNDLRLPNGLNASSTANFFNLFTYGNATTTGSLYTGGDFSVLGSSIFSNNVSVTGYVTSTAGLFTQGNGHFGGTLSVDGNSTTTNHFEADGTFYVKDSKIGIGSVPLSGPWQVYIDNDTFAGTPGGALQVGSNVSGGIINMGIYSLAQGSSQNYGVSGTASGAASANYGVYGTASGGTTNWAGYFGSGNAYIQNNLGIATTTPGGTYGEKLTVTGGSYFDGNSTTTNHFEADGSFYVKDGKVGIQTASPSAVLDIVDSNNWDGDGYSVRAVSTGGHIDTSNVYAGYFGATGSHFGTNYGIYTTASGAGANYALYSAAGENYFAGNVGIGNASPNDALDIYGNDSGEVSIHIANANTSGDASIIFDITSGNNFTIGAENLNNEFVIAYGDNTATDPVVRIQYDGDMLLDDDLYVGNDSTSDDDYIYFDGATEHIRWDESPGEFNISDDVSITGNLGVGTSADASYLLKLSKAGSGMMYLENTFSSDWMGVSLSGANTQIFSSDSFQFFAGGGTSSPWNAGFSFFGTTKNFYDSTGNLDFSIHSTGYTAAGSGTMNYVDGSGDSYIQDELEVDGNAYLSALNMDGYITMDNFSILNAGAIQANQIYDNDDTVLQIADNLDVTGYIYDSNSTLYLNDNVGVGTSNAYARLVVNSSSASTETVAAILQNSNNNYGTGVALNFYASGVSSTAGTPYGGGQISVIRQVGSGADMVFRVANATPTLSEVMRLTDNEYVKIGDAGTVNYANGNGDLYVENIIEVDNRIYIGTGGGYIYSDSGSRLAIPNDLYVQTSSANTYLYSANTYLGASNGDNIHTRGNAVNIGANSFGSGATTGGLNITNYTGDAGQDGIKFYEGATRVGEIGTTDTIWLRINGITNKNIYTPRYFRADKGFYVGDDEYIYQYGEDVVGTLDGLYVGLNAGIGVGPNSNTSPNRGNYYRLDVQVPEGGGISPFRIGNDFDGELMYMEGGRGGLVVNNYGGAAGSQQAAMTVNNYGSGGGYVPYAGYFFSDGGTTSNYGIGVQAGHDTGTGTNYLMRWFDGNGTSIGDVTFTGGTVTYGAFTGNHNASIPSANNADGYPYGTIVCNTKTTRDDPEFSHQSQYSVAPCTTEYDKRVFGVYSSKYDIENNLHSIYALGDGHALITSENGPINVGDYITTSNLDGYGKKATKAGTMLGTAMEDWDGNSGNQVTLDDGTVVYTKLISVYYYPGTYYSPISDLLVDNTENYDETLAVQEAETYFGTIYVISEAGFESKVVFADDIEVKGKIYVSSDQAGSVTIPVGSTSMSVLFGGEYEVVPKITATADLPVAIGVKNKTVSGFTIYLTESLEENVNVDWIALAVKVDNTIPQITNMTASSASVSLGVPVELFAWVTDADSLDSDLSYVWSVTPNIGTLEHTSSNNVVLTVEDGEISQDTTVTIQVIVTDEKGNSDSDSIDILIQNVGFGGDDNGGNSTSTEPIIVLGCTDQTALNYNSLATDDDNSCEYELVDNPTSTDPIVENPTSTSTDEVVVLGCTDPDALNYNDTATDDDDSCEYDEEIVDNSTSTNPIVGNPTPTSTDEVVAQQPQGEVGASTQP